jgi:rhodanese-related sulfurtransferase
VFFVDTIEPKEWVFLVRTSEQRPRVDEAPVRTGGDRSRIAMPGVRDEPEWDAGHAPGAAHVRPAGPVTGAASRSAAQGEPPVVTCRTGHPSRQAAGPLAGCGADPTDVEGGTNAWAAAGHPVVDRRGNSGSIA